MKLKDFLVLFEGHNLNEEVVIENDWEPVKEVLLNGVITLNRGAWQPCEEPYTKIGEIQ